MLSLSRNQRVLAAGPVDEVVSVCSSPFTRLRLCSFALTLRLLGHFLTAQRIETSGTRKLELGFDQRPPVQDREVRFYHYWYFLQQHETIHEDVLFSSAAGFFTEMTPVSHRHTRTNSYNHTQTLMLAPK